MLFYYNVIYTVRVYDASINIQCHASIIYKIMASVMVLLYLRYLYLELPGNSLAIYVTYFRPGSTGRAL